VIQFSTGGRSGAGRERGGALPLRPDMASLSVGSNNFPKRVYENPPELVEWLAAEMTRYNITPEVEAFDLSHILRAQAMHKAGPDRAVFDFYVHIMQSRTPDAPWCAAGIGPDQLTINEWAIAAGGHTRAGLEDNIRLDRHTLAPSNAALIARAADLCEKYERPVATITQTREILGLRPVTA